MSEKAMVTIDRGLIIPEDSEKIFENQYVRLEAGIECKGTLIFRNCTIEPCATLESKNGRKPACKPGCISMGIDGKLEMDGCKVIHPGQDFLSSWNMVIKNTSFLITLYPDNGIGFHSVLAPCVIAAHGKARFEGCSFVEETGNGFQDSELDLICFDVANIDNCTFKNITGKIEVDTISGCSFTGCAYIGGTKISSSTFTDCGSVSSENEGGYIRNCDFVHVKAVFATGSDIDSCKFREIGCDTEDDGVIFIEDCKITHCSFDDVELRNGSYLVNGSGDACVEYCQFTNCRTDRDDGEICRGKIETGKLRKKTIEVDILRDDTCTGLDKIERLD